MIKALKLKKAVIAIIFGVIALVIAQIVSDNDTKTSKILLAVSGALFIIGALLFLYPIIFARKVDNDGKKVELKPVAKEPVEAS
jgi:membrane protein CcdC involved in cytochrome C biogenesis